MRLEQLTYVVTIADCCSISKAAKKLYVTQPALSNALRDLEKELNFPIFYRNAQGVSLTEKGEELYRIAKSIQSDLEQIRRLSAKGYHADKVTIAAAPLVCCYTFFETMDSIRIAFPELNLSISELRPKQMARALSEGTADIGLCGYPVSRRREFSELAVQLGLERESLARWPFAAFLPPRHPLAGESVVSLEQLKGEPIICFADYETSGTQAYGIRAACTFSDRAGIKDAVSHGKGCALLPLSMALDDVYFECDKIKVVPLKETSLLHVDLVYRRPKTITEEETAILEIIRSYIRKADARLNQQFLKVRKQATGSSVWLPY